MATDDNGPRTKDLKGTLSVSRNCYFDGEACTHTREYVRLAQKPSAHVYDESGLWYDGPGAVIQNVSSCIGWLGLGSCTQPRYYDTRGPTFAMQHVLQIGPYITV